MGLMEIELARLEHRQRQAEAEQRRRFRQTLQEREQPDGQECTQTDWPLITLRFGRFSLALFRTLRLPAAGVSSHGTSGLLPG